MRTPLVRAAAVHLRPAGLFAALALAAALTTLTTGWAPSARAHGQAFPLEGDSVLVRTDQGPGSVAFSFSSLEPAGFVVGHDPAAEGAALLVRGQGVDGGRTPLVTLDPARWSALPGGGFQYDDPSGARGGITGVVYRNGELDITGTRDNWGWSPAGPQSALWVHFRVEDEWYCAGFPASSASVNTAGHFEAAGAAAPAACPEQVCGNGVHELGEECDDGNLEAGDGCNLDCTVGECNAETFETTWEGIQSVVFEGGYSCTNAACHDSVLPAADLDLTHDHAYESLLGVDGLGAAASTGSLKRVLPTEPEESLLYLKLAARKPGYDGPDVGPPMPTGLAALSDEHLEAVRLWIRGAAPQDRVVAGTAELLGTCLPPADPLKTPPPNPPPVAEGFQLQQTARPLPGLATSQGENEICMATWFDLSARLPETAALPCPETFVPRSACSNDRNQLCTGDAECGSGNTCFPVKNTTNPDGTCVAYDRLTLAQDPQSHHAILGIYTGASDTSDPRWGPWTYKLEPTDPEYAAKHGEPCDPLDIDPALGFNPGCSSEMRDSIACVGYGPADLGNLNILGGGGGGNLPQVLISQETYYDYRYAPGVYNVMPMQGIMVWNSHAFNLTETDSTLAQYLNIEYAPEPEREHESIELFDADKIFAQFVPPFETLEVCGSSTLPRGTRLFQLSSHTHRHGVRWRTWGPPNTPCQPHCPGFEDDPFLGLLEQFGLCSEEPGVPYCEPRDDQPMYFSTSYSDPLNMSIDPPLELDSKYRKDRTFLFCATYDNGATPESPPVKQQSTSPYPPSLFGFPPTLLEVLGGPCPRQTVACLNDGPMKGQKCNDDDSVCDSAPGAGDGQCDACPVHGGVTTEDEMFILLGNYYRVPEPGAASLALAAAGALALLARRRRRVRA